jgi:hypothetical protein
MVKSKGTCIYGSFNISDMICHQETCVLSPIPHEHSRGIVCEERYCTWSLQKQSSVFVRIT